MHASAFLIKLLKSNQIFPEVRFKLENIPAILCHLIGHTTIHCASHDHVNLQWKHGKFSSQLNLTNTEDREQPNINEGRCFSSWGPNKSSLISSSICHEFKLRILITIRKRNILGSFRKSTNYS